MQVPRWEGAGCSAEVWSWLDNSIPGTGRWIVLLSWECLGRELEKEGGKGKAMKMWSNPQCSLCSAPIWHWSWNRMSSVMSLYSAAALHVGLDPSVICSRFTSEFCSVYQQGFFTFRSSSKVPPVSSTQWSCQIQCLCPAWSSIWSLFLRANGHQAAASTCSHTSSE